MPKFKYDINGHLYDLMEFASIDLTAARSRRTVASMKSGLEGVARQAGAGHPDFVLICGHELGRQFRALRLSMGLSVAELSERSGITATQIMRIETTACKTVHFGRLWKLLSVFGVEEHDINDLMKFYQGLLVHGASDIGLEIRVARGRAGVSRNELARMIGMFTNRLGDIEQGVNMNPDPEILKMAYRALGLGETLLRE